MHVSSSNAVMQICNFCTYNCTDRHKAFLLSALTVLKLCWQLWNPAAVWWIKTQFACSLAEELFLACQDKQFFSVFPDILNMLDPFCIFFDCGKMALKYKSELESAKKLTEMYSNVTYCFIASRQRCSHRLGVMKIRGASLRKLAVSLCSSLMRCTAFLQWLSASCTERTCTAASQKVGACSEKRATMHTA